MTAAREPVSTRCDPTVWNAARAAAQGMLAHDSQYSMALLVENALRAEVARLEQQFHAGRPWPQPRPLRRGRRIDADVGTGPPESRS